MSDTPDDQSAEARGEAVESGDGPESPDDDPNSDDAGSAEDDEPNLIDDPTKWLRDPDRAHNVTDFMRGLREALTSFLPGSPVSLSGNFFMDRAVVQEAVGGSKYSGSAAGRFSGRLDSGRVAEQVLKEVSATYVRPDHYETIRYRLERDYIILLCAPPGWGRATAAIHMLDALHPTGVWKLNPEVQLGALDTAQLTESAGYLLESLESEQAAKLRPFHVEQLAGRLRERGCRLVITVDAAAPLRRELLGDLVLDGGPAADAIQVVSQHVTWRATTATSTFDPEILDRPETQELLRNAGASVSGAQQLTELAMMLADAAAGHTDIAAVKERFSAKWDSKFRDWFDSQEDAAQRAFMIALAVFNGMSEHVVQREAWWLADAIGTSESSEGTAVQPVFGKAAHIRLSDADAEQIDGTELTQYGITPTRVTRYRDDRYPLKILEHVWREYEGTHEIVMRWLRRMAADQDRRVRVRAGAAAGLISLFDFDRIRRELLLPWASSQDSRECEAVLGALQLPSRDPRLAPLTSRMIADWCQPHQPLSLRKTAARALGASVGRTLPGRALRLLGKLADAADHRLTNAVCASVVELFVDDEKDLVGVVLDALLRWTDSEGQERRTTAVLCALQLSYDLVIEVPPSTTPWPALVWLADNDESHGTQIAALLGRVLDTPHLFHLGYDVLHKWVQTAESDSRIARPLSAIMKKLAVDAQDAETLVHYLKEWAETDNGPVGAVEMIRRLMTEEEMSA